jgi:tRNA1(Val) A37 N6-methylase TrmN6
MDPAPGIIRPPRRPPGWIAPGPPPAAPHDAALGPGPGEDLCYLAGDWRIVQRVGGHRWSLDDLVTAWVAFDECVQSPPEQLVDLGCGIGTVLMLLAWRWSSLRAVGIEAQAASVALARRSIAWNGAADRLSVRHGDVREPASTADLRDLPLVTGTPPYLGRAAATASAESQRAHCRVELAGGVEDYVRAAAALLGPTGRFVMCAASRQRARVADVAARAGLSAARRLVVIPRAQKPPLFDVHVLARRPAARERVEALVVRDADGRRTDDFVAVRAAFGMPP